MNSKVIVLAAVIAIAAAFGVGYLIHPMNAKNTSQSNNTTNTTNENGTNGTVSDDLSNTPTGSDSQMATSNGVKVYYVMTKDINGVTYYYSQKYGGWYTLSQLVQKYVQENPPANQQLSTQSNTHSGDTQNNPEWNSSGQVDYYPNGYTGNPADTA